MLDEPTTGLDSETSLVMMEYLLKVVRFSGICCIVTIHQPSAQLFAQLDDLLLLTHGKTAYFGPIHRAAEYFHSRGFSVPATTNPADYYLDLINAKPAEIAALRNKDSTRAVVSATFDIT